MFSCYHKRFIILIKSFFNSSLFKFCFRDNFPELLGGTRELRKIFFDKISVIKVSDKINNDFKREVINLQSNYTQEKAAKIDLMLFDLYNLTEEERKVIGNIEIK